MYPEKTRYCFNSKIKIEVSGRKFVLKKPYKATSVKNNKVTLFIFMSIIKGDSGLNHDFSLI